MELNQYEKERSVSRCMAKRLGALSTPGKEDVRRNESSLPQHSPLAVCAAMWPQNEPAEETPAPPKPAAVIAAQPEVLEMPEIEDSIMPEEEKTDTTPVRASRRSYHRTGTIAHSNTSIE